MFRLHRRRMAGVAAMAGAVTLTALLAGCGPTVWVESVERFEVSASDLDRIEAKTHNGQIMVDAVQLEGQPIVVEARIRAGGRTEARARECLDALEVVSKTTAGTHYLGRRLNRTPAGDWGTRVSFRVAVPPRLAVSATSHNGMLQVTGVKGDCHLQSHNGRIIARTESTKMTAETHNGRLEVAAPASQVRLLTHNGRIQANLDVAGAVAGTITSHNGGIDLVLADQAAARLTCRTHNGIVRCQRSLTELTSRRSFVSGRLGEADTDLHVETHNGSITVR